MSTKPSIGFSPRPWSINPGWKAKYGHMDDASPIIHALGLPVMEPTDIVDIHEDDLQLIVDAVNSYGASRPAPAVHEMPFAWRWPDGAWQTGIPSAADHANLERERMAPEYAYTVAALTLTEAKMLGALQALAKVRPENWDDAEDPELAAAWRLLDDALAEAKP